MSKNQTIATWAAFVLTAMRSKYGLFGDAFAKFAQIKAKRYSANVGYIGPVANDTVGLVLNQLIIGTYGNPLSLSAKEMAIKLLEPEKLYNQVLFKTDRSIENLRFKEAYSIAVDR